MEVPGLRSTATHELTSTQPQQVDQPLHLSMPVFPQLDPNAPLNFKASVLPADPRVDQALGRR